MRRARRRRRATAIACAVTALGHALEMTVIAEGIETTGPGRAAARDRLRLRAQLGHFSRPAPPNRDRRVASDRAVRPTCPHPFGQVSGEATYPPLPRPSNEAMRPMERAAGCTYNLACMADQHGTRDGQAKRGADVWNPQQVSALPGRAQPAVLRPDGARPAEAGHAAGRRSRLWPCQADSSCISRRQRDDRADVVRGDALGQGPGAHAGDGPRFEKQDVTTFAPEAGFDPVFSNATLNWVEDHLGARRVVDHGLAPGGQIAVQVPANDDHFLTCDDRRRRAEPPFREALGDSVRCSPALLPEQYAELLNRHGYQEQHVRAGLRARARPTRGSRRGQGQLADRVREAP